MPPCRPRRDNPVCEHGRPESCEVRHGGDDPQLGQPICVDCYDYFHADRPIREVADVARLDVAVHAQRMIYTCFALVNDPAYRLIPLRQWAHMLGYRGHSSTKSRHHSTTLGALRQVRADHQAERARERRGLLEISGRR